MTNNNSSRPPSNQPGNGGNWPSSTDNKSGGKRGNAVPASNKK
jgi:hypothetical protein